MFGHRYFGIPFFGSHYFGPSSAAVASTSHNPIIAPERGNSVHGSESQLSITAADRVSIRAGARGFAIRVPRRGVITSENS